MEILVVELALVVVSIADDVFTVYDDAQSDGMVYLDIDQQAQEDGPMIFNKYHASKHIHNNNILLKHWKYFKGPKQDTDGMEESQEHADHVSMTASISYTLRRCWRRYPNIHILY